MEECSFVERLLTGQHVVNGSTELNRQASVGPRLVVFLFDAGGKVSRRFVGAFQKRNCLAERLFQMPVADLVAAAGVTLAGRTMRSLHQATVRKELTNAGEPIDRLNLVKHRHRKYSAHARYRLQAVKRLGIIDFRRLFEIQLGFGNDPIVLLEQFEIEFNRAASAWLGKPLGDSLSIRFVAEVLGEQRQIVLHSHELNVAEGFGSSSHEKRSATQQIASGPQVFGVNEAERKVSAAQQHGDLFGIDRVVLGFSAVNGLHVKGVAESKRQILFFAQVRQPVPVECRLTTDDQIVLGEGTYCRDPVVGLVGGEVLMQQFVSRRIDDACMHHLCMQIDAAVEFMLLVVEVHHVSP